MTTTKTIRRLVILVLPLLLLFVSCSPKEETGPGDVRWDRVVCARCAMAVSDPHYSAQIRGGPIEKRTQLYFFDDLGCAVIWLNKQDWKAEARNEIWVNDWESGQWIEARTAFYVKDKITPMDYGLGATAKQGPGTLNFTEALAHIDAVTVRKTGKPCCDSAPPFLKKGGK